MRRLPSNHLRELITFVLALSVSVCCCQAHFLLHGLAGADEGPESAVAAETGCCANCSEETDESKPGGDEPQAPVTSCKSCCVKGSGLKDGITVPPIDVADALPAVIETPMVSLVRLSTETPCCDAPPPFVEPRTLVRLHCALLV